MYNTAISCWNCISLTSGKSFADRKRHRTRRTLVGKWTMLASRRVINNALGNQIFNHSVTLKAW